jgi:hypothetical protein
MLCVCVNFGSWEMKGQKNATHFFLSFKENEFSRKGKNRKKGNIREPSLIKTSF